MTGENRGRTPAKRRRGGLRYNLPHKPKRKGKTMIRATLTIQDEEGSAIKSQVTFKTEEVHEFLAFVDSVRIIQESTAENTDIYLHICFNPAE